MAWSTPVTQTTSTHITAAVWNAQIADNMAFLGNTHNHDGDPGDGSLYALLPQGIILIADANCPSGWTRVSAFDGLFVRGASSYGGTGGGGTHTHSHTHTSGYHAHDQNADAQSYVVDAAKIVVASSYEVSADMSQGSAGASHYSMGSGFLQKSLTLGTDAAAGTVLPAYIEVIFCKKN
jgi:hypothetical protein